MADRTSIQSKKENTSQDNIQILPLQQPTAHSQDNIKISPLQQPHTHSQDDIEVSPLQTPTAAHLDVPPLDLYKIDGKRRFHPDGFVLESSSATTDTSERLKSTSSVTVEEKPHDGVKEPRRRKRSFLSRRTRGKKQRLRRQWSIHENPNEDHPRGIYWRSPISMVVFFISGFLACLAHHLVYLALDRKEVGSDNKQQWVLRFGTAFAYIAQVSFVCSTGLAVTQNLWMTLKRRPVSVLALDVAFQADQTILSLLNPEFVSKMRIVALLSLIAWCLPLPSLVTPGTILILPHYNSTAVQQNVSRLDYSTYAQANLSSVSVLFNNTNNALFLGPRTLISRLSTATATLGSILPMSGPFPISSYSLDFYGPSINCSQAPPETAIIIDALRNQSIASYNGTIREIKNNYYAFVPDFSGAGDTSRLDNGVKLVSTTRQQQPANASNQLWMVYSRYIWDESGNQGVEDYFSVCKLYNTSYHAEITFNQTLQNVIATNQEQLDEIPYPDEYKDVYSLDTMIKHAYSAYMWAITDLLVGSIGIFSENSTENSGFYANFGEITSRIEHTSLLGTSDLDVYFDSHHLLTNPSKNTTGQRAQDIALAGNRTLEQLIPELGFNVTFSLLSSNMTSPNYMTTVNQTTLINIYTYHRAPLLISYSLATGFALLAVLLGAWAYRENGCSHSRSFSAILASTRAANLAGLFHDELMGRLPLHENVQRTRLEFGPWKSELVGEEEGRRRKSSAGERVGGWGFQYGYAGDPNILDRNLERVLNAFKRVLLRRGRSKVSQVGTDVDLEAGLQEK